MKAKVQDEFLVIQNRKGRPKIFSIFNIPGRILSCLSEATIKKIEEKQKEREGK